MPVSGGMREALLSHSGKRTLGKQAEPVSVCRYLRRKATARTNAGVSDANRSGVRELHPLDTSASSRRTLSTAIQSVHYFSD
jgi:hypothetical protein